MKTFQRKRKGNKLKKIKNIKKKLKKKKKIIKYKHQDNDSKDEADSGDDLDDEQPESKMHSNTVKLAQNTKLSKRQYNNMKYDEADNTFSGNSEQTQEEGEDRFLAPIYRVPAENKSSSRKSYNEGEMRKQLLGMVSKSYPMTPNRHQKLLSPMECLQKELRPELSVDK